jgi:hypothetical protein
MIPRVRRAVEGVGSEAILSDDEIKDLIADAIAEIILYTDSVFGKTLEVVDTDNVTGAPIEYGTSEALTLAEQSVVAVQATLDHFFHKFVNMKTSEVIADEAQRWEWGKSAQLLRDQLAYLIRLRDEALEQVRDEGYAVERYASFLLVRDRHTAALVEPWVAGALGVGLEGDVRFAGSP